MESWGSTSTQKFILVCASEGSYQAGFLGGGLNVLACDLGLDYACLILVLSSYLVQSLRGISNGLMTK